ncbi:hypothetical protein KVT40_002229 [Elsinoe batatas]|uniref:Uncharacterized protein n=1 Tax=Elsinoe batatas TaxID=2601811 RepID=A0A8K0LAP1_9PEZI|nr:hypothetical protein KVT40_002229 [Elsinoe batatas]
MIPLPSVSTPDREPSPSQDDATTSDATTATVPTTSATPSTSNIPTATATPSNATTASNSNTAGGPVFTYEAMMASATASNSRPAVSTPRLTRAAAIASANSPDRGPFNTSPVLTLDKVMKSASSSTTGPATTSSTVPPRSSCQQTPSIESFEYPLPAPAFVPNHPRPHAFRYQLHAGDPVPFSTESWADQSGYQCRPDGRATAHTSLHQLRAKLFELYIAGHTIDETYQTLDDLAANITEVLNLLQTEVIEQSVKREVEHGDRLALIESTDFGTGAFDVMAEFRDKEAEEKAGRKRELEKVKEDNLLLGCIIEAWRKVAEERAEELGILKKDGKGKEEKQEGGEMGNDQGEIANEEEKKKTNDASKPTVDDGGKDDVGKEREEDSDLVTMLRAAFAGDCAASGDAATGEKENEAK